MKQRMWTYNPAKIITYTCSVIALAWLFAGCAGGGKKSGGGGGASFEEVSGAIMSSNGTSAEFKDWIVALINLRTGESRTSKISITGDFSFKRLSSGVPYTIVVMNAAYRLTSVLAMAAADRENKVRFAFTLSGKALPRLIYKGLTVEFTDPSAVSMQNQFANDDDGDGIPNGMEAIATALVDENAFNLTTQPAGHEDMDYLRLLSYREPRGSRTYGTDSDDLVSASEYLNLTDAPDSDEDGIKNTEDPDIDGDGLVNWVDGDDNNNNSFDIFDLDANGDGVADTSQSIGDRYFGTEIEYATVQVYSQPDSVLKLRFAVKINKSLAPASVSILSSASMLDQARVVKKNDQGQEEANDVWDLSLTDDGNNFDDTAADSIFARKIKLKAGSTIRTNQLLFIRLDFGTYTRDIPYLFTNLTYATIGHNYNAAENRTITRNGNIFSDISTYSWFVHVYNNSTGALVHTSTAIESTRGTYSIPAGVIESGITYDANVQAQSYEKVPNRPEFLMEDTRAVLQ